MDKIFKTIFIVLILATACSHKGGKAVRKADLKLLAQARQMLGKNVQAPLEDDFEKFCDVGFGEGTQLIEVGRESNQDGRGLNPIYLFGWVKGKVEKIPLNQNYGDMAPGIKIISFLNEKDLIWIGGNRDYESSASLYTCVDGTSKKVLEYEYYARQPSVGDTLTTEIRPTGERDLIVSRDEMDYGNRDGSFQRLGKISSEQLYVWSNFRKVYVESGKPKVLTDPKSETRIGQ